jgi:hypothetical protein
MPPPLALPELRYGPVRLLWCRAALVALIKRWSLYIALGVLMLCAFSSGALTAMAALVAWSVLPVFKSAGGPLWLTALATLAHAGVGGLIVLAWRPLLWPAGWLETERALPMAPRARWRSDLQVVALALLPLFALYVAGALTWSLQAPAWLNGMRWQAWGQLLASMGTSVALGMTAVQRLRRPQRLARSAGKGMGAHALPEQARLHRPAQATAGLAPLRRVPAWRALIVWPVWQGPARRVGHMLVGSTLALWALEGVLAFAAPAWAPWWLAGWGLLLMAAGGRLHSLIHSDLQPLHAACAPLPLAPRTLAHWRLALALLPTGLGLAGMVLAWGLAPAQVRPAVARLYGCALASSQLWLLRRPSVQAQAQVSRWLLTLVVLTAIASEVFV